MFRYSKVINEYEFPPLDVLHYLLITLRLGRHFKGEFRLAKRGAELAQAPALLFAELMASPRNPAVTDLRALKAVESRSAEFVSNNNR